MGAILGTYMFWARMAQLTNIASIVGINGRLIHIIESRRLGLEPRVIAIQNLAASVLIYTLVSIVALHIFGKSKRTYLVFMFILGDMIFTGVCLAILTIYSIASVPANCGGLTRDNWGPEDAPNNPHKGFTTIRFGHGLYGSYGELDVYCVLPKTNYALTVVLIFSYGLNISLAVLRILSFRYTHRSEVERLVVEADTKGRGSYSDLASLITSVASIEPSPPNRSPPSSPAPSFHSSPTNQYPPCSPIPARSNSPAPSFHTSPQNINFNTNRHPSHPDAYAPATPSTSSSQSSFPSTRAHPFPPSSFLHSSSSPIGAQPLPDDTTEIPLEDIADELVCNGSRGGENADGTVPPPYMADLEANTGRSASLGRSELGRYGKDGEFPGLR